ncbi:MAG: MFS transporter [Labilithrix sp.]|nr:MFS transporter [Labilithrix sp.]
MDLVATAQRARASTSLIGLNAANFFLAEVIGVVLPFLNDLLREQHWRYDTIGVATSTVGLGVFLFQTPAGMIVDRVRTRRSLLAATSVTLGVCFGLIPIAAAHPAIIFPMLFVAGVSQAFFQPLLGALALGLAGHDGMNRMMGQNQAWNHAGNIAAAGTAMLLATVFGIESIFVAIMAVSLLAAASTRLIRPEDVAHATTEEPGASRGSLLRDGRARTLLASTALFHLANAPVMPMVALDIKRLHGTDAQVAAVVLIAQTVMVPVAYLAGRLGDRFGRKPIMLFGFAVLPVRIFLYSLTDTPSILLALQSLDGIGAGLYGVLVPSMCADITAGKGRFNTLLGMIATAQALGAVMGPLASGFVIQHMGFDAAFQTYAAVALVGALLFFWKMPETRTSLSASIARTSIGDA